MGAQRRRLWRGLPAYLAGLGCVQGSGPSLRALFQDFEEQRELAIGRALPIELLGVETGCGAGRRRCEEFADRDRQPVRADIGQMRPASAVPTISAMPSIGETTTGVPQAMLSNKTLGQPSWVETSRRRSAAP